MFSALYKSYLSPLYWLIRVLGKDPKEADRNDIPDDEFRLCLKPRYGAQTKKIAKACRTVFHKLAGFDEMDVNEAVEEYFRLTNEYVKAREDNESFADEVSASQKRDRYLAETFTIQVTEDERQEIFDYLKKDNSLIVVQDEYKMVKASADHRAYLRKIELFEQQAFDRMQEMGSEPDWDDDEDDIDYDDEVERQAAS